MVDGSVCLNLRSPLMKMGLRADFFTGPVVGHEFSFPEITRSKSVVYSQEKRLRIPRAQHGSHRDTSDLFSIPPLPLLFVPILINMAREKGVSAYIDEGLNRWPAVHRLDAAHLFRLAFEKGDASAYYHGVAEEGVPFRQIAEVIGRLLNVPVVGKASDEAAAYFTWFTHFAALDVPASSKQTQEKLGWHPNSTWINRRH